MESSPKRLRRDAASRQLLVRLSLSLLMLLVLYGLWPSVTLWHLERALAGSDLDALAELVDLDAIRTELARALNKERDSAIERFSDGFIEELEAGLRRHGQSVLDEMVTMQWVQARLSATDARESGLFSAVSGVWMKGPTDLRLRLVGTDEHPVTLRLSLVGGQWRVTMIAA